MALGLSLFCCTVVALTLGSYGIAWDEGPYMLAGKRYVAWLLEPAIDTVDRYWSLNHEHPPLVKVLGGMSDYICHQVLSFTDSVTAFRLQTLIFVFFLTYGLFCFSAELYGNGVALVVTLSFFFLPRIFYHSHLAALDYPLTALWFLTVYTFWKGLRKGWKWIITSSLLLGFALLIKLAAFFIYVPLAIWWLVEAWDALKRQSLQKGDSPIRKRHGLFLKPVPIIIVPPALLIALWPWLWRGTFDRLSQYLLFHADHFEIPVFYLGKQYGVAPWHYPAALVLVTVPMIVMVPFVIGLLRTNDPGNRKTNAFILFNGLFPILIASLPGIPKYDGIRLFMPAFPFLLMVSGLGLRFLFDKIRETRLRTVFMGSYGVLFLMSFYFSVVKMHPYQSSYYSEAVGGFSGASDKGFEHEYWGSPYKDVLTWLNRNSQQTFWLGMADIDPKAAFPFVFYKEMGLLSKNVRFTQEDEADYAVLLIRQGLFDREKWQYYQKEIPVFSVKHSGRMLIGIYKTRKGK